MGHNLSNQKVKRLFESWGFVAQDFSGGHLRMRHHDLDKVVQISAPGRQDKTPPRAIKKGADALGITYNEFLNGPINNKTKQVFPDEFAKMFIEAPQQQNQSDQEVLEFRSPKRKVDKVRAVLMRWPNMDISLDTISSLTGLTRSEVSMVCSNAARNDTTIERTGRGKYSFIAPQVTTQEPMASVVENSEEKVEDNGEELVDTSAFFTVIHVDQHGRTILSDANGDTWVAIRVEPGFMSFTK